MMKVARRILRPDHHYAIGLGDGDAGEDAARTTLKIAVLAPIPKASVSTATAVKPGLFFSIRRP